MVRLMEVCHECAGYGVVVEFGVFSEAFYGPKECPKCHGTRMIPMRDSRGRYMSDKKLVPLFETEVLNR